MRIVSLVPSATEIVCLLGAESMLVGRSHECDHPPGVAGLPALTAQSWDGTGLSPAEVDDVVSRTLGPGAAASDSASSGRSLYRLDAARLQSLRPDLIITQDLCSVCSIDAGTVRSIAGEMRPRPVVLSLNPQSVEGVFDDVITVGRAIGREAAAMDVLVALRERFFRAADYVNSFARALPCVFIEWVDPIFVGGHWTPQLVERAGASHPLNPTRAMEGAGAGAGGQMAHRLAGPSIRVTPQQVVDAAPEAVIVSPCGVALAEAREQARLLEEKDWWRLLPAVGAGKAAVVDGNQMFSRPGPRLVDAYEWLVGWLNDRPELIPRGFPWMPLR